MQEEGTATCAERYEAKSSATALTVQICHFDGYTYADTGLPFFSCVTTTFCCSVLTAPSLRSKCSTCLIARTRLLARTCVVGCVGYELASGDSLRALTCVSKHESVACLTGSLLACQVTRCSTSTKPMPMRVSEDCKHITYGASCQAACTVGFESANHTELSCLVVGQSESNSVPFYPVCEEKNCVDLATSDSSMLAPDCTDLTSGDQCKVMRAAGYTGVASTLTCTLDVVNGSVFLIGILPNCSAASWAVDGIPSGMSHECDGIAFRESCCARTQLPTPKMKPTEDSWARSRSGEERLRESEAPASRQHDQTGSKSSHHQRARSKRPVTGFRNETSAVVRAAKSWILQVQGEQINQENGNARCGRCETAPRTPKQSATTRRDYPPVPRRVYRKPSSQCLKTVNYRSQRHRPPQMLNATSHKQGACTTGATPCSVCMGLITGVQLRASQSKKHATCKGEPNHHHTNSKFSIIA